MRKKQVLFFLITALSIFLLPACGAGGDTQTSDTSDMPETTITGTEVSSETSGVTGGLSQSLEFEFISTQTPNGMESITESQTIVVTTRTEFESLYSGKSGELENKALACFTDEFFENYTVIIRVRLLSGQTFLHEAVSVVKENGELSVNVYCYRSEGTAQAGEIKTYLLILNKNDYNGETLTFPNIKYKYFRDDGTTYKQEIYKNDLEALEKYRSLPFSETTAQVTGPSETEPPVEFEFPFTSKDSSFKYDYFSVQIDGTEHSCPEESFAQPVTIKTRTELLSLYDDYELRAPGKVREFFTDGFFENHVILVFIISMDVYSLFDDVVYLEKADGKINAMIKVYGISISGPQPLTGEILRQNHAYIILDKTDFNGEEVCAVVFSEAAEHTLAHELLTEKINRDLTALEKYMP